MCADSPAAGAGAPRLARFNPAHLLAIELGTHETALLGGFDIARCAARWPAGPALSVLSAAGRVLGCGGLHRSGGEAWGWILLSDELRRRPFVLHRLVRRALDRLGPGAGRIRATVPLEFAAGHRWARALGFAPAGVLPHYGPNGETFVEYER